MKIIRTVPAAELASKTVASASKNLNQIITELETALHQIKYHREAFEKEDGLSDKASRLDSIVTHIRQMESHINYAALADDAACLDTIERIGVLNAAA